MSSERVPRNGPHGGAISSDIPYAMDFSQALDKLVDIAGYLRQAQIAIWLHHVANGVDTTGNPAARYSGVFVGLMNRVASFMAKGSIPTSQPPKYRGKSA